MKTRKLVLLSTMAAALAAAGCSSGGDSTARGPTPPTNPPTQPDPTPQPKTEVFTTWLKDGVLAKGEDDGGLPQAMDDIEFDHSGDENSAVFAGVIPPAEPVVVPPDVDAGT